MTKISNIKDKQNESLKGRSDADKALAAARRVMEEMRSKRSLKEPDQLASGKSDKDGKMIVEELDADEDIDCGNDNLEESKND